MKKLIAGAIVALSLLSTAVANSVYTIDDINPEAYELFMEKTGKDAEYEPTYNEIIDEDYEHFSLDYLEFIVYILNNDNFEKDTDFHPLNDEIALMF